MTRALNFPRPLGVLDAEAKRAAGILAEVSETERKIVVENSRGPYILKFTNPYDAFGEILEVIRSLEAKGYEFGPGAWTRDKAGVINGLAFTETTRCL